MLADPREAEGVAGCSGASASADLPPRPGDGLHDQEGAESALRDERLVLRTLIDSIPDLIFTKDRAGRFSLCNRALLEFTGVSAEQQLAGKTVFELFPPEQARGYHEDDMRVIRDGETILDREELARDATGRDTWRQVMKAPLKDPSGAIVGLVGVSRDIQARKEREAVLAKSQERLRILHQIDRALIAGEGPEPIAAAALPPLRELLGVRRAIVNLFDLDAREVEWLAAAGMRRIHVGPGVRYSMEFMGDVEALQRGEPQFLDASELPPGPEVDALLASGVSNYVVVPMIARGELIGALSFGGSQAPITADQISIAKEAAAQFAIALTQARLHERVARQAQELEIRVRERTRELEEAQARLQAKNDELLGLTAELQAANKELDAFSYSVSHDLRAPLRAIDGFSRIVLSDYADALPAGAQQYLRDVRSNAQRMGRLVEDLLGFSRLVRQPIRKQPCDPSTIVRQCLDELCPEQEGRSVEIRTGELPECLADPALLKQVWLNLLSNAVKYTGRKASTRIEIGSLAGDRPGWRTYFVKDNGVGFDMRYARKLFGVFQRLHRAEDYEGSGVGLAIVQRILHRHGGRIWVEAQPDLGATFFFSLEQIPMESVFCP